MALRCVVLVFLLIRSLATGQIDNGYWVNYSSANGLQTNAVYCTHQDNSGYVWFGTDAGLIRYDGYDFIRQQESDGIDADEVLDRYEAPSGDTYFYGLGGIVIKKTAKGFKTIRLAQKKVGYVSSVFEEGKDVFVGTSSGHVFQLINDKIVDQWFIDANVRLIGKVNEKLLFYTQWEVFELQGEEMHGVGLLPREIVTRRTAVFKDTVVLSQGNSLQYYDGIRVVRQIPIPNGSTIITINHLDDKLAVGTRNGFFFWDGTSWSDVHLSEYEVSDVYMDNWGNTWATTLFNGVMLSQNPNLRIIYEAEGGSTLTCFELIDKNTVLLGSTRNQISRISNTGRTIYELPYSSRGRIENIEQFGEEYWISAKSGIAQLKNGTFKSYPFGGTNVIEFYEGQMYMGGRFLILHDTLEFEGIEPFEERSRFDTRNVLERESIERVFALEKYQKELWIGTLDGIHVYDGHSVQKLASKTKSLKLRVHGFHVSGDKMIVASDEGVYVFKNRTLIKYFDRQNSELSTNRILSIHEKGKNLWLGTDRGLYQIKHPDSGEMKISYVGYQYGLEHLNIKEIASYGNYIFILTKDRIIRFDEREKISLPAPVLRFGEIWVNGRMMDGIGNLSHSENNIEFRMNGISPGYGDDIVYAYFLEGYSKGWREQNSRNIFFEGLPHGNYTLRVKATVNGQTTERKLSFSIDKPFWVRWWFRGVVILVVIVLISTIWFLRLKQVKRRHELDKKFLLKDIEYARLQRDLAETEQKALRMQMNPHFIFNALNAIKGFYANHNEEEGNEYIGKFSRLLRNILESSSDLILLEKELEIIETYLYLSQQRFKNKIEYTIEVSDELDQDVFPVKVPPMIYQPIVENSIVHGTNEKGKCLISIRFRLDGDALICEIQDNGPGIEQTKKNGRKGHQSLSLQLIQERLTLLREKTKAPARAEFIDLTSTGKGKGTLVRIITPTNYG